MSTHLECTNELSSSDWANEDNFYDWVNAHSFYDSASVDKWSCVPTMPEDVGEQCKTRFYHIVRFVVCNHLILKSIQTLTRCI
ncbi:unnamed protein product [Calicophoron daubneyi]|uniref:Uncharacterized protein n=1 Tax=Calicophoron daubneyi TaxID=300641 RepID=A0AAV2TRT3_CALDB